MESKLKDLIRAAVSKFSYDKLELISVGYANSGHFSVQCPNQFGEFGIIAFKMSERYLEVSLLDYTWCSLYTGNSMKHSTRADFNIEFHDLNAWHKFLAELEISVGSWLESYKIACDEIEEFVNV